MTAAIAIIREDAGGVNVPERDPVVVVVGEEADDVVEVAVATSVSRYVSLGQILLKSVEIHTLTCGDFAQQSLIFGKWVAGTGTAIAISRGAVTCCILQAAEVAVVVI